MNSTRATVRAPDGTTGATGAAARTWHGPLSGAALRECRRLWCSPGDLALATWLPWVLMALLAWFLSAAVPRGLPIAVVDEDHSPLSRELVRLLDAAPGIRVAERPAALLDAWPLTRALTVDAVVHIPAGAQADLLRDGQATVTAWYNAIYQTAGQSAARDIAAAVQAASLALVERDLAASPGSGVPLLQVQTTLLFNPARSHEHFLLRLLLPAVLVLAFALSVTGALGRELRDGTAPAWLAAAGGRPGVALIGKLAPHLLLFLFHGTAMLVWLGAIRGDGVAGSVPMLLLGLAGMLLAQTATALLLVGATRRLSTAISLTSLYAGTALAFSGYTLALEGAPLFTRVWSTLLPLTHYLDLQVQQLDIGSPWTVSLRPLAVLLAFVLVAGAPGLGLYLRAARDPAAWGLA